MGLKRTQGQKRNCKKGTRKQQNKRTGKRKTAKKNLRRKRQTKRRLKGGSGLGIRKEGDTKKRNAENGPTNAEEPKHKAENWPNLEEEEEEGYSPAVKRRRFFVTDPMGEAQEGYNEIQNAINNLEDSNKYSEKKKMKTIRTLRAPFASYSQLSKNANSENALYYDPKEE